MAGTAASWSGRPRHGRGPSFAERVYVHSSPWAQFSFADESCRAELAAFVSEHDVDLVIAGPLAELGAKGAGTPDDVTAFAGLVSDFRSRAARPVALLVIHHENKGQDISGAWGRWPDTIFRFSLQGRGRTVVRIRKARHSRWLIPFQWS